MEKRYRTVKRTTFEGMQLKGQDHRNLLGNWTQKLSQPCGCHNLCLKHLCASSPFPPPPSPPALKFFSSFKKTKHSCCRGPSWSRSIAAESTSMYQSKTALSSMHKTNKNKLGKETKMFVSGSNSKYFTRVKVLRWQRLKWQNTVLQARNSIVCTKDCSGQRAGDVQVLSCIYFYFPSSEWEQGTPGFG